MFNLVKSTHKLHPISKISNLFKTKPKQFHKSTLNYADTKTIESNAQNQGTTHFGFETVRESEKAEKGTIGWHLAQGIRFCCSCCRCL